jgi:hypothetical protein
MIEPRHAIDLSRFAFKRDLGDVTIYGSWLYNEDQEDTEPCLVLTPRYRFSGMTPCCIALSAAFRYNEPRYLVHASAQFAKNMGFADSMTTTHKIAMVIHDHLGDLLNMPVDPVQEIVVGEASVDLGNGKKRTVEFLDHEPERQV